MHWVMRMSRLRASSMYDCMPSMYCGAVSVIRPAAVASVISDV